MSALRVGDHDIEPYLPRTMPDARKELAWKHALTIHHAIEYREPLRAEYGGVERIIHPHSLYRQDKTPPRSFDISPYRARRYPWKRKLSTHGARTAVGIDVYQILSGHERSMEGWRSLHLDRFDELQLLTRDTAIGVVGGLHGGYDELTYDLRPEFVKNWNYWFRDYITQAPSLYDLKVPSAKEIPILSLGKKESLRKRFAQMVIGLDIKDNQVSQLLSCDYQSQSTEHLPVYVWLRIKKFITICEYISMLLGKDRVKGWLNAENQAFDGQKALDVMTSHPDEGISRVEGYLGGVLGGNCS